MDPILDSPTRTKVVIVYADAAGVGNIVIGSQETIGNSDFTLRSPNIIIDATARAAPASTDDYSLSIRRQNGNVKLIANWTDILPTNAQRPKNVMPVGVNDGWLQFIAEETVAASSGLTVSWTFAKPLNV